MIGKSILGLTATLACGCLFAQEPGQPASPPAFSPAAAVKVEAAGPLITFATNVYDFGKVKAGDMVKYTYYFTNTGDQNLVISTVHPSCGCTTAGDFSKDVAPGQTGSIPVQFDSTKFSGPVHKVVTVTSNDKQHPSVALHLDGLVWKPIDIVPPYPVLTVSPEATNAHINVRVVSNLEEPFVVSDPTSSNPGFAVAIARTNSPNKEYLLSITALPGINPGSVQGKATLKTSITNMPTLEIPFWANVLPAVTVSPPSIFLSQRPLTQKTSSYIILQDNTSTPLKISEPAVNIPGVEWKITEPNPGKLINVQFMFAEGFELPAGQEAVFTAKSSVPQMPVIRVPIQQALHQDGRAQAAAEANPAHPAQFPPPAPVKPLRIQQ